MAKVLVTGSAGFIGGYVVEELLARGHEVVGRRQLLQVRPGRRSPTTTTRATSFVEGDARDVELLTELLADCDHFIAGAAMIGGISYFHAYAYDLLATNERIMAASCDAAIAAHRERPAAEGHLPVARRWCSSRPTHWPPTEGDERRSPAAAVVLRLPEARRRVLRPGGLGPVPAAVHDRAPVQLRRHRRGPGARRRRGPLRQRRSWP